MPILTLKNRTQVLNQLNQVYLPKTTLYVPRFLLIHSDQEETTGPLKKLFHYAIFQKFFHIFLNT